MHEYSIHTGEWEPSLQDNRQSILCNEFKEDLSVGVWNATALFCRDSERARMRLQYVIKLAEKVDVLVVVEAHGQEGCQYVPFD
jgi:hypothetical protein